MSVGQMRPVSLALIQPPDGSDGGLVIGGRVMRHLFRQQFTASVECLSLPVESQTLQREGCCRSTQLLVALIFQCLTAVEPMNRSTPPVPSYLETKSLFLQAIEREVRWFKCDQISVIGLCGPLRSSPCTSIRRFIVMGYCLDSTDGIKGTPRWLV